MDRTKVFELNCIYVNKLYKLYVFGDKKTHLLIGSVSHRMRLVYLRRELAHLSRLYLKLKCASSRLDTKTNLMSASAFVAVPFFVIIENFSRYFYH